MFSGIVEELGYVADVKITGESARISVRGRLFSDPIPKLGESTAICGVCLTIIEVNEGIAQFDLASETRRCTTLGKLAPGSRVNLERSLQVGERIHGHFVQGHVDTMSTLVDRIEEENTVKLIFSLPAVVRDLVAPKGSVTLDGVSLTVGEVTKTEFSVYIIPHTAEVTTLGLIRVGDQVNVEADCLARYVKTIMQCAEQK